MEKNASAAVKPPARAIRKITLGRNTYSVPEIVVGVLLLVPSIVFLVFTFVIPVVQVVELSLTNFNMATGEMSFIGLRNYRYLLENSDFWLSMWNTCKYSAAKLIFDTSLALLIAVQLDKNIPLKKFLRSTYFAPVVVPMVASSLIWIWFYDPQVGPFNQILSFLGLPELKWLYSEHTAMISILLFSIWKGLGYNVVLFLSGLQNISDSYLEGEVPAASAHHQLRGHHVHHQLLQGVHGDQRHDPQRRPPGVHPPHRQLYLRAGLHQRPHGPGLRRGAAAVRRHLHLDPDPLRHGCEKGRGL